MPKKTLNYQVIWKWLFTLSALEGAFALFFTFYPRSEKENALFLGFSTERWILAISCFLLLLFFALLSIQAWMDRRLYMKAIAWLEVRLQNKEKLYVIIIWGGMALALLLLMNILLLSPLAVHLNDLRGYLIRLLPISLWVTALLFQTEMLVLMRYAIKVQIRIRDIFKAFLAPSLLFISILHWLILAFRIQIFTIIDGWFWGFHLKETLHFWFFIPIFLLSLFVVFIILKCPTKTTRNIFLLTTLAYFLQLSFGFIATGRVSSIQKQYVSSGHKSYVLYAADRPPLRNIFFYYEENYGEDMFAGTKPPGVILFYVLTQRASAIIFPQNNYALRLKGLVTLITYLYPFLASLMVPLLYRFSRLFLPKDKAIIPPLLYIFFPNFLLMPLFLDQVLYPLLFIAGLDLAFRFLIRRSYALAFLSGIFIYVAVYFTFSLLPLGLLVFLLVGIYFLVKKNKWTHFSLAVSLALGFLLSLVFFYVTFDYDVMLRYNHAISQHKALKSYEFGFRQILNAILLNNIDYDSSIGFPFVILTVAHGIRTLIDSIKKKSPSIMDMLTLAFLIAYSILLLAGQTRGEVGRLWLFFNPLIALFSTKIILDFFKKTTFAIPYLVTLELITTIFLFKFQNFL